MSFRKIIILITITLCATMTNCIQLLAGGTSRTFTKEHPMRVLCDWNYPPYEFSNESGMPSGYDVEIMDKLLNTLKIPHVFEMQESEQQKKLYAAGDYDLTMSAWDGGESDSSSYGSIPLTYYHISAIHSNKIHPIRTLGDLRNHKVVVAAGDFSIRILLDNGVRRKNIIEVRDAKMALRDISRNIADYMLWDEANAKWYIRKLKMDDLQISQTKVPSLNIYLKSTDSAILNQLDNEIINMQQSGFMDEMHSKWFNPENKQGKNHFYTVIIIGLVFLAITALLFILNSLMGYRIRKAKKRAAELLQIHLLALKLSKVSLVNVDPVSLTCSGDDFDFGRIHADYYNDFVNKIRSLKKESEHVIECVIKYNIGSDAEAKWTHMMVVAVFEKAKKSNIVMTYKDINLEIEEHQRYKENTKKYLSIFDSALLGLSFYDSKGFLINSNKKMCEIFKTKNLSLDIGKYNLFEGQNIADAMDVNSVRPFYGTMLVKIKKRELDLYVDIQIEPVYYDDGKLKYIIVAARDVTEERSLYLNLIDNARQYRNAEKHMDHYLKLLSYVLEKSNTRMWESDSISGKCFFTDEKGNVISDIPIDLISDSEEMYHVHYVKNYYPGKDAWILFTAIMKKDGKGNPIGYLGLARDISELVESSRKLDEATRKAAHNDKMKSVFLANMSHEIRTPLNAIVGFSQLLDTVNDNEKKEFIRIINNNCDLLMRLIDDILELGEMDQSIQSLTYKDVDWAVAFDDFCKSLSQRVTNPDVEFIISNDYQSLKTRLDSGRLNQVITNFVTNAVKYTKRGYIKVGYQYENKGLYIYCEDTGSGIPEKDQDKIFERFVKLDDFVQGTGLGLSICKVIAERYQGKIGVDSQVGKGSKFWIWVPCHVISSTPALPGSES